MPSGDGPASHPASFGEPIERNASGLANGQPFPSLDVRYWPKADMAGCVARVCFRGQSGHQVQTSVGRVETTQRCRCVHGGDGSVPRLTFAVCSRARERFQLTCGARFTHHAAHSERILKTAKALGITIPHNLLVAADEVIERVHVRYWPKVDMTVCAAHVRFQG